MGALLALTFIAAVVGACSSKTKKNSESNQPAKTPTATTADAFFQQAALHPLQIKLSEVAMESLRDKPRRYVEGEFHYGGLTYPVSVKLKGNRSFRKLDEKPAIKLRFDKPKPEGRFLGQKRLTLNNMVDDPTRMRESIGYEIFRAAGVAAPRTTYATVRLNDRPVGIYLVLEPVDEVFVANRFSEPIGGLYEAEYGCDFFPPDVEKFERDRGPESSRASLALASKAVSEQSPDLWIENSPYLNSPAIISYLAVSTLVGDFDGYWHSHNYFIYQDGPEGTWNLIPWGIDRVFNDRVNIFDSRGRLAEVCFANPDCTLAYARRLKEVSLLIDELGLPKKMRAIFAALGKNELVDKDPWDDKTQDERQKKRRRMREYLKERPQEIRDALTCLQDSNEVDPDSDGYGCNDCDSSDASVHPGAIEICDDIDNDCNGHVDDAAACGCERIEVRATEFHLCNWEMSWAEARDFCSSMGLSLAHFENEEQSSEVFEAAIETAKSRWWIGATDLQVEGEWLGADARPLAWEHWDPGQPNDNQCGQDCAALDSAENGRWVDAHCEQHYPFVCR